MANTYGEPVGLLLRGTILSFNSQKGTIRVKLNNASSASLSEVDVPSPNALFFNNGLYIGSSPKAGSTIIVGQGSGGQYYFVSFLSENPQKTPTTADGELLLQANDNTFVSIATNNEIWAGSLKNRIHLNTFENYISQNFASTFSFTQSSRKIEGTVKRDLFPNQNLDSNSKLENDQINARLITIALDPTASSNNLTTSPLKNPPFTESREIIYELQQDSDVQDDLSESILYQGAGTNSQNYSFPNRRKSRADTFSLSLVAPNFLMESVKGTAIDIFGNILDINRAPIPVGTNDATLQADQNIDKSKAFLKIKELERKSLAFHFEINARKNLTDQNGTSALPDVNSNADYGRTRSRFFIDIDKEGQFKMNIPASSESGNVPLLTRYENYSTFGSEDNGNPNKLIFREDRLDIFQDSFAAKGKKATPDGFAVNDERGVITLKEGAAEVSPLDRIVSAQLNESIHIKHGTAHHDILGTCFSHQDNQYLNYQAGSTSPITVDISKIPILTDVVSSTIQIGQNAGGRSGQINMDGSLELNIGANTIDRQSLILDLAGGIVGNVGRDIKNRSAILGLDGDVLIQIGGDGISGDSRFIKQFNQFRGGTFDLRVVSDGGYSAILRIDKEGITIMSPANIAVHSKGNLKISSDAKMELDAEEMIIMGRGVKKILGGSL